MAPPDPEPVRRHAMGVFVESMLFGAIALAVTFVGFMAVGLLVAGFWTGVLFGLAAGVCGGIPVYLAVATAMVRRNLDAGRRRGPVVAHIVVTIGLVAIVVGLVTTA